MGRSHWEGPTLNRAEPLEWGGKKQGIYMETRLSMDMATESGIHPGTATANNWIQFHLYLPPKLLQALF